jgi:hypothetical protein
MALTDPAVAEQRPDIYLPDPPDDTEKYKYFGKQRRWVFAWLLIASVGVLDGYIHVAQHAWLIAPLMWLLLMVMVPPIVVNFWLRVGPPRLTMAASTRPPWPATGKSSTTRRWTYSCPAVVSRWPYWTTRSGT